MSLRISGKNIEISDAYRTHVEDADRRRLSRNISTEAFLAVSCWSETARGYRVDCALHLDSGVDLQAEGRGHEIYPTFEQAAERIDKQLRRYKRRLKDHHHEASRIVPDADANYVVLAATPESDEEIAAGLQSDGDRRGNDAAADAFRVRRRHGDGPCQRAGGRVPPCRPWRRQCRLSPP